MTTRKLRRGDIVQVRSPEEILATLDERGRLDQLPFMPEMLPYCGQQFQVYQRADKTCDTVTGTGGRRLTHTVHLRELRCDGQAHGGCQAGCLLFWKEAWLRRIDETEVDHHTASQSLADSPPDVETLLAHAVYQEGSDVTEHAPRYACQATELLHASTPLSKWDIRQYVRDVWSKNLSLGQLLKLWGLAAAHRIVRIGVGYRFLLASYETLSRIFGGLPYPFRSGTISDADPTPSLQTGLQPGDVVRVRSFDDIRQTLNTTNRNRGLRFDAEMVPYCGQTHQVERRVHNIINEQTGEMMHFRNPCIVLEGVVCQSRYSSGRLGCPRRIPSYWREIWLDRVTPSEPNCQTESELH